MLCLAGKGGNVHQEYEKSPPLSLRVVFIRIVPEGITNNFTLLLFTLCLVFTQNARTSNSLEYTKLFTLTVYFI